MLDKNNTPIEHFRAQAYQDRLEPGGPDSKRYFDPGFVDPTLQYILPVKDRPAQTIIGVMRTTRRRRVNTTNKEYISRAYPLPNPEKETPTAESIREEYLAGYRKSMPSYGNTYKTVDPQRAPFILAYNASPKVDFEQEIKERKEKFEALDKQLQEALMVKGKFVDDKGENTAAMLKAKSSGIKVRDFVFSEPPTSTDTESHPQVFEARKFALKFFYLQELVCRYNIFDLPDEETLPEDFDRLVELKIINPEKDFRHPLIRTMVAYGTRRRIARELGKPIPCWDGNEVMLPPRGKWTVRPSDLKRPSDAKIDEFTRYFDHARKKEKYWADIYRLKYSERGFLERGYVKHYWRKHGLYGLRMLGIEDEVAERMYSHRRKDANYVPFKDLVKKDTGAPPTIVVSESQTAAESSILASNQDKPASATADTELVQPSPTLLSPDEASKLASDKRRKEKGKGKATLHPHNSEVISNTTETFEALSEKASEKTTELAQTETEEEVARPEKSVHECNNASGPAPAQSTDGECTYEVKVEKLADSLVEPPSAGLSPQQTEQSINLPQSTTQEVEQTTQPSPALGKKRAREDDDAGEKNADPSTLPPPAKKIKMESTVEEPSLNNAKPLRRSSRATRSVVRGASEAPQPVPKTTKKAAKDKAPAATTESRKRPREEETGEENRKESSLPAKRAKRQTSVAPPVEEESKPVRRSTRVTRASSRQPSVAPVSTTVKPSRSKRAPKRVNGGVKTEELAVNLGAQEPAGLDEKEADKANLEPSEKPKETHDEQASAGSSSKPLRRSTRTRKTQARGLQAVKEEIAEDLI